MPSNLSRRALLAGTASAMLWTATGRRALALTPQVATQLVQQMVAEITSIINSGRSANQMFGDFERFFRKYADEDIIARTVLGPPARTASAGQMRAFTDAFVGYISRKYGKRFRELIGGRIEVHGARQLNANTVEVDTTTYRQGAAPVQVSYRVSDRPGTPLFFDMVIEGIPLLRTEGLEVRAIYDQNGRDIGRLTEALKRAG
jgi:phospholipid transport system substrate-binding protein